MANNENLIPIPGRLHSVATEGHVAGANEIYDDTLSKDQETINSESAYLENASGTAVIPSFDPQADSLHKSAQVLSAAEKAQVKQNLGIDGDLSNLNNSILAEATRAEVAEGALDGRVDTLEEESLFKTEQTLTTAQKDQVAQNIFNKNATNGMARIELKATDNFKSVVEAQTGGNTIFIIKYDFTLTGDVTIPANCVLKFDGGSISGEHTITGASTGIEAGLVKIFSTEVTLNGSWNVADVYSDWFGIDKSGNTDVTTLVNKIINFAHIIKCGHIVFGVGTYLVTSIDITRKEGLIIDGCGYASASVIQYKRPHTEFLVTGVNSVGFDLTDAKSVTLQNFTIKGDDRNNGANKPKTLILISRSSFEANTNYNRLTNIETDGHTSYYHLLIDNAEINRFDNCVFSGYAKRAIVGLIYKNEDVPSPYVGSEQAMDSMTCNHFCNCDILQYALEEDDFLNPSCVYIEGGQLNSSFRDCYFRSVGYGNNYPHAFVFDEKYAPIEGLIIENIRQENGNHGGMFIKTINNDIYKPALNLTIRNCYVSNTSNEGIFALGSIHHSFIESIHLMNKTEDNNKCVVEDVVGCLINVPADTDIEFRSSFIESSIIFGNTTNLATRTSFSENSLVLGYDASQFCNYIYDKVNKVGKFKESGESLLLPRTETATRPNLPTYFKGVCMFDTDISKPIFWNGTAWVDATGATV